MNQNKGTVKSVFSKSYWKVICTTAKTAKTGIFDWLTINVISLSPVSWIRKLNEPHLAPWQ